MPALISCSKHLSSLLAGIAGNLGLTIKLEESEKRELLASPYYSIFAAKSPHRQTISYPIARHELRRGRLLSMTSDLSEVDSFDLQMAVNQELERLSPGSYLFRFSEHGELIDIGEVFSMNHYGPLLILRLQLWKMRYALRMIYLLGVAKVWLQVGSQ